MLAGDYQYILQGYANASNTIVLRVEFKYNSGLNQVRAKILNDSAIWQSTPFVTLSDAPHALEVDWSAATAPGANDGHLAFWVDGLLRGELTGVDNDTYRMESARLGVVYISMIGTQGTVYFDSLTCFGGEDFTSR